MLCLVGAKSQNEFVVFAVNCEQEPQSLETQLLLLHFNYAQIKHARYLLVSFMEVVAVDFAAAVSSHVNYFYIKLN